MSADWSRWALGGILLALGVTALVGFGEEFYVRGILRASLRANHGETLTLLVTSLVFGLAHSFGSLISGQGEEFIVFQVFITALDGAAYYGVIRATGRLWPSMVLHALTDFSLTIGGTFGGPVSAAQPSPLVVIPQAAVWVLLVVLLISCIRQDLNARRDRSAQK